MKDQVAELTRLPLVHWAFTTIRHDRLASALTSRATGADRGRQSASPRITGGLVSHDQGKRSIPG